MRFVPWELMVKKRKPYNMYILTDGDVTRTIVHQPAVNQKLVILPVNVKHVEDVVHHMTAVSVLRTVPHVISVLVKITTRLCVVRPGRNQHMN
jgi:hypothetical protein